VFDYVNESISTRKFIDILLDNKMFGDNKDIDDKNIFYKDIQNIKSFGTLFNGNIDNKTGEII